MATKRTLRPHLLFVNVQGHGHVYPTLELVAELCHSGYRVSYMTGPEFTNAIESAGADPILYRSEFDDFHVPDVMNKDDAETQLHMVYIRENIAILEAAKQALRDDPPDLIIYDIMPFFAGRLLATFWGVPAVRVNSGFAENEHYSMFEALWDSHGHRHATDIDEVSDFISALLGEYGVETPPLDYWREIEQLNIINIPKGFQIAAETFDSRFVFVGPSFGGRVDGSWTPPTDAERIILISLGTLFNEQPAFFKTCINALARSDWHVVITVGRHMDPAELGPTPDNVEVHQWVPFHEVLAHADVCLTQGTMGATMEALDQGVPLLVAPEFATEAGPTANQSVALGLAYELPSNAGTSLTRELIEGLAADKNVKAAVTRLQSEIHRSGGARLAAERIGALLAQTRTNAMTSLVSGEAPR